ncbi:type IV toxin-antitoxin system AbiEi family antitoxin [Isoptericola aurantiacus]|uniref:type IV toxin-antitoxin system AbiEi family antitoxin n=1 Tax=Isoptericola aurantiacus TaxID=3377839 RepID=UPI00383B880F
MDDTHELVERITERWRDDGVHVSLAGPRARLEVDGISLERRWTRVDDSKSARRQILRRPDGSEGTLLIGDRIPPSLAERARRHDTWYVDAAGNAYVRAPGVRIDIRGRKKPAPDRIAPAAQETNLMSARRAQVIFSLLTWPELVGMPMRDIAQSAGTSVGMAHSTIKALTEERYLFPGASAVDHRDDLIERWATAFPLGLARSLELGRFRGEPYSQAWSSAGRDVYISGEPAVEGLQGPDLTLYVHDLEPALVARSRWRRPEPGESGNIIVRRKFWTELNPPPDVDRGEPAARRAPPLLIYADLLASREPRQREAALAMRGGLLENG